MSQAPADQTPPQADQSLPVRPEAVPPAGGSWPPVPPPLINRLVSSATATPFVPEENRPAISELSFSCVVEPPPKRTRLRGSAEEKPSPSARSVQPTASAVPSARGKPAVVPNPAIASASSPPAVVPLATVPPFAVGGTTAPFAPASEAPFEFNPGKPPRVRWLSWSTLILVAGCAAGYFQYQRMQAAKPAPALDGAVAAAAAAPAPTNEQAGGEPQASSIATPFTALKQAKATIKDAGAKHRAAYDLVEKMLDDPNAVADAAAKPAPPPMLAPAPEPTAKPKHDPVAALLGRDGEFVVPVDSPTPSLRFARWVRAAKIGGARLNERPRVLVGAVAFGFGDVVDIGLGIVLDGYNAERRALRFRETSTGAVIERRL